MEASSHYNGNFIRWDKKTKKWYYYDGTEADKPKKCPKCHKLPDENEHDACLGNLPGVKNACCGHGGHEGYIQFENDVIIRFRLNKIENNS
jgi:hypothetical protein